MRTFSLLLRTVFLLFCGASTAATLTISPSVITNDYRGIITLQIAVPSGSSVRIDKLLDLNANGTIEATDLIMDSAKVTDGELPLVGGVRNINVPGDEDGSANGNLRVEFKFPGISPTLAKLSGRFIYRVVGPGEAVIGSAIFEVRQKIYVQGIEGRVTNSAGTGISGAIILVSDPATSGVVTDANGNYRVYTAAGPREVIVIKPGSVTRFDEVNVPANSFLEYNAGAFSAPFSLSGAVVDEMSGAPVPGVFLFLENEEGFTSVAVSGTNGSFSAAAFGGEWYGFVEEDTIASKGYIVPFDDEFFNITSNISGLEVELEKGTALIYGTVRANGQPVADAEIEAEQIPGHLPLGEGRSYDDGRYAVAVMAGSVRLFVQDNAGLYIDLNTNVTVAANQALMADLNFQVPTAQLQGRIIDDQGNPVSGFSVSACSFTSGVGSTCISSDLQPDGTFDLGVFGGSWTLNYPLEELSSQNLLAASGVTYQVNDGQTRSNITVILRRTTRRITGVVRELGNLTPLSGLQVFASYFDGTNSWFASSRTDSQGSYSLSVFPASWRVEVSSFELQQRGYAPEPSVNLTVAAQDLDQNFNVERVSAYITGRVITENNTPVTFVGISAVPTEGPSSNASTDGNGQFVLAARNGVWSLQLSSFEASNRQLIGPIISLTITDDRSISNVIVVARTRSLTISGAIDDSAGNPLQDLQVFGNATVNGTNYFTFAETDDQGNYQLPAFVGNWTISLDCFSFNGLSSRGYNCPPSITTNITANRTVNFSVAPAGALDIESPSDLPAATLDMPYSYAFSATGGMGPYNWSFENGVLPFGIAFSSFGSLSGTPSSSGAYQFTLRVTDANSSFDVQTFTLVVNGPTEPTLLQMPQKAGTDFTFNVTGASVGQNYTVWWSTNLTSWFVLYNTNAPGSTFTVRDNAGGARKFYRVE